MTVYIVQEVTGKNLVPARKFGELKVLLPERTNLMLSTGPEIARLKRQLADFNDEDYLLLIGDPAAIGICCAVAATINGNFSVLKWDRQEMDYYPVKFNLRTNSQELGALNV